jgi:ribonuclease HI
MNLLKAMQDMEHQGITHVVFETDSKSMVNAIYNLHGGASEFSFLFVILNMSDIKLKLCGKVY